MYKVEYKDVPKNRFEFNPIDPRIRIRIRISVTSIKVETKKYDSINKSTDSLSTIYFP